MKAKLVRNVKKIAAVATGALFWHLQNFLAFDAPYIYVNAFESELAPFSFIGFAYKYCSEL